MRNKIIESDLEFIAKANLPWHVLQDKTVLISGAAGFLPSYMVDALMFLNETLNLNIKTIGLVRDLPRAQKRFAHIGSEFLQLVEQNICEHFAINEKIDLIIHAASQATPKVFESDPVGTLLPNVIGTKNLLEIAVQNHVENFLFFSTSGVYGHVDDDEYPITEDCFGRLDPTQLSACYLESKRMGENMCIAWHSQHGVPVKIVRPAITYGPGVGLDDGRSFADFIACIVKGEDIKLYSDGKVLRNYCYIADAVLGFFTVWLKGENGQAYNVASDIDIGVRELAEYLVTEVFSERKLNVTVSVDHSKNFLRTNFARTTVDISKAKSLGWRLSFSIAEGFKRTVQSFEE
ncbi:NAD-dependent epimerase/dehydratase family protein [Methylomonas sp. YC3]